MRRACCMCQGTDCQSQCEQGQCYAEHMQAMEAREAADREAQWLEECGGNHEDTNVND